MYYYQENQAAAWELAQGHMNNGIISNQKIAKFKSLTESNSILCSLAPYVGCVPT